VEGRAFEAFVEDPEGLAGLLCCKAELRGVVDQPLHLPVDGLCPPVPGRLVLPLPRHALGHSDGLGIEVPQPAADVLIKTVDDGRAVLWSAMLLVWLGLYWDMVQLVAVPDLLEHLVLVPRPQLLLAQQLACFDDVFFGSLAGALNS
jgi:hypothetical protein